jgi:hypothetical protein
MCEDCGLKQPSLGLPDDEAMRWCSGCAKAHSGAQSKLKHLCEDCGLKQPSFGLPDDETRRWCAGCAEAHPGTESKWKRPNQPKQPKQPKQTKQPKRYKGVSWHQQTQKWRAQISHGGKKESLGCFATEEEAKARYDARCLELGIDLDAGISSGFRGVCWFKRDRKWQVQIRVNGKQKKLGAFEGTARGEVDAALAYDVAARFEGRLEKANFELAPPGSDSEAPTDTDGGIASPDQLDTKACEVCYSSGASTGHPQPAHMSRPA